MAIAKPRVVHEATDRLSLLAKVGEIVVAIDATVVFQIHHSAELAVRQIETNLYAIEAEGRSIPGWDLGELFGVGACDKAWVLVDLKVKESLRRIGLRVGQCIAVRRLPPCHALPGNLVAKRPGMIAGAFATEKLEELQDTPSGVVLDVAHLLTKAEFEAGARISREPRRPE